MGIFAPRARRPVVAATTRPAIPATRGPPRRLPNEIRMPLIVRSERLSVQRNRRLRAWIRWRGSLPGPVRPAADMSALAAALLTLTPALPGGGVQQDIVYKTVNQVPLHLDLYPASGAGPHPLVLWIHGGA